MTWLINIFMGLVYGPIVWTFYMKSGNQFTISSGKITIESAGYDITSWKIVQGPHWKQTPFHLDGSQVEAIIRHHKRCRP